MKRHNLPFETIEALSKSSYTILTPPKGNPTTKIITEADETSDFYPLIKNRLKVEFYSWLGLVSRTKDLSQNTKETIFCDKNYIMDRLSPKDCKISIAWESRSPIVYMTMVVSKDSPYTEFFNHELLKLMEIGIIDHLSLKNRPKCGDLSTEIDAASLKKTISLFILLGIGMISSLICFTIEILRPQFLDKIHKKYKMDTDEILEDIDRIGIKLAKITRFAENHKVQKKLEECIETLDSIKNIIDE